MRTDKRSSHKADKKSSARGHKQGVVGYSKKSALLEEAITHMNTGKYGRSSAALKELLALDPQNIEARRLFATLHLRLGSLVTAREAFESLANEAIGRQDYWLAESLLREYLAAGPRCIPFLEQLAHVYEEKGDAMAAVAELGKAVEILLEDPDPDHPQKPSQLYGKIRELAPASPVAFRFASSFDIQTGEFRLPHRSVSDDQPTPEKQSGAPTIGSDAAVLADASPEIMPWERFDEPTRPEPATSIIQFEPVGSGPSPNLSNQESASTKPAIPLAAGGSTPDSEFPGETTPIELQGGSVTTIGPSVSLAGPSEIAEPSDEPEAEISWEAKAPIEQSCLPSRMPWEHVADPALEIVESETAPAVVVSHDADSARHAEASLSATLPTETPSIPAQGERTGATDQNDAMTAGPVSQLVEAVSDAPASETPSTPTSFSWNAIFDTAWKIAVGTTAPNSPVIVKAPEEAAEPKSGKKLEPPSDTADQAEETETMTSSTAGSIDPGHESWQQTVLPSGDRLLQTEGTGIPVDSPSMSHPDADITPASDPSMHESVVEPHLPAAPADVEAAPQSLQASPTTVAPAADESMIPPMPTAENVQRESSETVTSPAVSLTEPSEAVETQTPLTMEPPPRLEEAQPPSSAPLVVDQPTEASAAPEAEAPSHWNTGEVAVQLHRPSARKKKWEKEPSETPQTSPSSSLASGPPTEPVSELSRGRESTETEATVPSGVFQEIALPVVEPKPPDTRPDWAQASDSISLDQPVSVPPARQEPASDSFYTIDEPTRSPAASAVDVLFGSTGQEQSIQTRERAASPKRGPRLAARLARVRLAVSSFIMSCFSTTRAFVLLCVSLVVLCLTTVALALGMLAITWMMMEEPPTQQYQSLTSSPQRQITDPKKNGFLLLMGFDASSGTDPLQAGYERQASEHDVAASQACILGHEAKGGVTGTGASSNVVDGWFKGSDPLTQLKGQPETVRSLAAQETTSLTRYQQWMTMSFDDWGFGQILSPNCPHILLTHRLFLLDGFNQDATAGLTRLEKDMESWRSVLGQSKSLMVKMMAVTAVQDDVTLASALLMKPDTDSVAVSRLSKVVRPLDQLELSIRWPMQSHFTWATRNVTAELKKDRTEERPIHVSVAAAMPLPVQRRANEYAEYYVAANKAVAEGRYVDLPKASQFLRTSPSNLLAYWANPIEHIIGIEALPWWDPYVGRMVETDALLRLASLQVWVRRGPQDGDMLARLAKAGQAYYDPFTGLPMLVNQQKRLLYSVGRDGKDQEGDRRLDVVVAIPSGQSAGAESRRSSK